MTEETEIVAQSNNYRITRNANCYYIEMAVRNSMREFVWVPVGTDLSLSTCNLAYVSNTKTCFTISNILDFINNAKEEAFEAGKRHENSESALC